MIWMMPDALLARQLRVSGALASRHSQGGPQHAGVDDGITAPRGMGAPLRPHARERHGDLPPSCWHLGGGGVAVAADRASLRLSSETLPDWPTDLDRLAAVHRCVVGGL